VAAPAAAGDLEGGGARIIDQVPVDTRWSQLVDDHGDLTLQMSIQRPPQQGGFARAEKATEDRVSQHSSLSSNRRSSGSTVVCASRSAATHTWSRSRASS